MRAAVVAHFARCLNVFAPRENGLVTHADSSSAPPELRGVSATEDVLLEGIRKGDEHVFAELLHEVVHSPTAVFPTQADIEIVGEVENLEIDDDKTVTDDSKESTNPSSPATHLVVDTRATLAEPENVLTDVTNTPRTPLLEQKTRQRNDAFSEGADLDPQIIL